ncbi:MAG: amidohydrolase [Candidatus Saliniplasma sp.]
MKALINGRVVPITSEEFEGTILVDEGKIVDFGEDIEIPDEAEVIDVDGKTIIPGFIDAHCHVGISEEGEGWEGEDTNEMYDPITPHLRALDAINPDGIALKEAVNAGVTTINVGPGSANPIGGTFAAIKTAGSSIVDELVIKEPTGLKMATGENPKRVYKEQKKLPSTRMSTAALIREKLFETQEYIEDGEEKDFKLEALKPLLEKEIPGRIHAHRADDMVSAIRISEEYGFDLILEHCTEGHKIADYIADKGIPVVFGPGLAAKSKRENRERSFKTPGILSKKGIKVALMTDSPVIPIKYLALMAAYSVREGMDRDEALKAITINAAEICGIDDRVGSIEKGKDADLVVVDGDPLELQATIDKVFIDGEEIDTE